MSHCNGAFSMFSPNLWTTCTAVALLFFFALHFAQHCFVRSGAVSWLYAEWVEFSFGSHLRMECGALLFRDFMALKKVHWHIRYICSLLAAVIFLFSLRNVYHCVEEKAFGSFMLPYYIQNSEPQWMEHWRKKCRALRLRKCRKPFVCGRGECALSHCYAKPAHRQRQQQQQICMHIKVNPPPRRSPKTE